MVRRRQRDQRGAATLEMIGILPLAFLVAGAIIQLSMVGYAAVAAESAARLTAREASQGTSEGSAERAGEGAVNARFRPRVDLVGGVEAGDEPSVRPASVDDEVTARATLDVPFLGIGVENLDIEVTRYVVMPVTD